MSSAKSVRDRGELPPGKGAQNKASNPKNPVNASKGDAKSDKSDLTPKIMATAEQMQIARIIESHRAEDPELQRKIRQVMEITRTTEDKASMALHSRENNVEEAITLLTEGGTESLESEWEQAGKKRKPKTVAQKPDPVKDGGQKKDGVSGDKSARDRSEKRPDRERDSRTERPDRENSEQLQQGDGTGFESRRGGRGRGGINRGGRGGISRGGGRIENNKENDETNGSSRGYPNKFSNGPGRGGGGGGGRGRGGRGGGGGGYRGGDRDRDSSRTFASRTRAGPRTGEADFGSNTIDVWDNCQADPKAESKNQLKVEKWDEFPSAEDWDNEEYTGSLAESKVFTPSTQTQNVSVNSVAVDTTKTTGSAGSKVMEPSPNGPANHLAGQPTSVVAGQSIDLSLLLQKPQQAGNSSTNPGANLLASIQSSSYSSAAQQLPPSVQQQQQPLPPRHKDQTANRRVPPTGKMPSTGVEMPDKSITKLDVQFGGLDFGSSGPGFNSVVQQQPSTNKVGAGGDMLYNSQQQQSAGLVVDSYSTSSPSSTSEKSDPSKSNVIVPQQQQPGTSPFQNQRGTSSVASNEPGVGKTLPMSPNIENLQKTSTAVQQQQVPYCNANNVTGGSAFVPFNTKPAPGFSAPGFPPVSQAQPGTYPNYGSQQPSGAMLLQQQQQQQSGYHSIGLSSYGTQPIVSASVQPSGISQITNSSYGGIPTHMQPNPYHSANAIPSTTGYANSSTYAAYGNVQKLPNSLSTSAGKDGVNDVSGQGVSASTSAQLGNVAASTSASKLPSQQATNVTNSITGNTAAASKMQSSQIPPGMIMQPQYILNQGLPVYGFQGPPMYGYDENLQYLPRLPHPAAMAAAGYYDANSSSFAPGGVPGTGRSDGSSLQSYPGADGRFPRTDSSTASPVPSNLPGQTSQQPMYNIPQGSYYYLQNSNAAAAAAAMLHPGFSPYGPPPTMYPSTLMQSTPQTNPSTGAPHTVSNHQYQSKGLGGGYGGSAYMNPYESSVGPISGGTGGPTNAVTDYVSKNSYGSGGSSGGVGGPNSSTAKGSASSTGSGSSSQQSTDMSSSMYGGNKGHLNKMNAYDKQGSYGGSTTSPYNSMGQTTNQMVGSGMGTTYGVYMPQQPVLPHMFLQDNSSGQRQGGQPKGGNKQYGSQQQQYWNSN